MTGLKLEHVPYTGVSQAVTDIVAGRISVWLATLGGHLGNIQSGRVRALAVSGPARAQSLPDVPTFAEQGVALVEESTWFGIFVPKGTPQADHRQAQPRRGTGSGASPPCRRAPPSSASA